MNSNARNRSLPAGSPPIALQLLLILLFFWAFIGTAAANCTGTYTYTSTGGNTNYTLTAGQSLKIASGTYTGIIDNLANTATICVDSTATFKPGNMNNVAGKLLNYGTAELQTFAYNTGSVIDNYGTLKFLGGLNTNGAVTFYNRANATMTMANSFQLGNNSTFINDGLVSAAQDFNTQQGTTLTNNYRLETKGNFNPDGIFINNGRIYSEKFINMNSNLDVTNNCLLVSFDGFNSNNPNVTNNGTILITKPGNKWQHNAPGTFRNGANAKVAGQDFINNSTITGSGAFIFSGSTTNQGTFAGNSSSDKINFYDETQTGSQIFDFQNTAPTNTVRTAVARPTELDAPPTCSASYKNFANPPSDKDFGDAPASYGDASHGITSNLFLGDNPPSAENSSKTSFNARADDNDDGAPSQNAPGQYIPLFPILKATDTSYSIPIKVTNTTGTTATLAAWIDFDQNGTFEASEKASVSVPTSADKATVILQWASIPTTVQLGTTAIRLRLSTDSNLAATGFVSNGEVEDYPIAVAMHIPPNSPNISIINNTTPASCESVVFSDNFNDLAANVFWAANRPGASSIRNWVRNDGGNDSYARTVNVNGLSAQYGTSLYFGNGAVRQIQPPLNSGGFSFDSNGKLLTPIDAIALRDNMDDTTPGTTNTSDYGSHADWGPRPVTLARTFNTTPGKSYRLYFTALPEDNGTTSFPLPGIMRVDAPGGSIHFKAPASNGTAEKYAIEFTALGTTSTIRFINYGHVNSGNNGYCDPNSVFNANPWCSVGGGSQHANELIIDDVILTEAACATGSIAGKVYVDTNRNGIYDTSSEAGIASVTLKLYDETTNRLVTTANTDNNGGYSFAHLNTARTYRVEVDTTDPDIPSTLKLSTANPLSNVSVSANSVTNKDFGFNQQALSCSPPPATTTYAGSAVTWNHNQGHPQSAAGGHSYPNILNTSLVSSAANEAVNNLLTGPTDWELFTAASSVPTTLQQALNDNKYFQYSFTTKANLNNGYVLYGAAMSTLAKPNTWSQSGKYKLHVRVADNPSFHSPIVLHEGIQIDQNNPGVGAAVQEGPMYGNFYLGHYDFTQAINLEPNKTYYVRFYPYDVSEAGIAGGTGGRIIFDDLILKAHDCGALPSTLLTVNDAVTLEGNSGLSYLKFAVNLSANAPAGGVSFNYTTNNGTATVADNDYQATSGTITIPAGQNSAVISVPVVGDTTVEDNETLTLTISSVTNARYDTDLHPKPPQGVIINDDNTSACNAGSGHFGGLVFQDFNQNGLRDSGEIGLANVTVTAYAANNSAAATATTDSQGWYVLNGLTNGANYRLEFTNLPAGVEFAASNGNSASNVQFVTVSPSCNANLGVAYPADYCQAEPKLLASRYINGDNTKTGLGQPGTFPALLSFSYNASGVNANISHDALASQVGSIWGLAYNRNTKKAFATAMLRRYVGLGSLGLGGIYVVDYNTNPPTVNNFLNVQGLAGINVGSISSNAARGLPDDANKPSHDPTAFAKVGKEGLGAAELSEDGNTLYVTNLYQRKIIKIDLTTYNNNGTVPTTASQLDLPNVSCPNGVARPFALKHYRGQLYAGITCTGENNGTSADLKAFVYAYNGSTWTEKLQIPLNYRLWHADHRRRDTTKPYENWYRYNLPWRDNLSDFTLGQENGGIKWADDAQLLLSDIEFDTNGDMILALLDRTGLQFGHVNYGTNTSDTTQMYAVFANGDLLKASYNPTNGSYTLESEGKVNGIGGEGVKSGSNAVWPYGGLGDGEFYGGERFSGHTENSFGAVAFIPGKREVALNAMNPFNLQTGGTIWLSNDSGNRTRGTELYGENGRFLGKAVGLGDLEVLCDPAPVEIGNRVWLDTDKDGIQDAGENGISNVSVTLTCGADSATTTTNSAGEYYFSNAPGKNATFMGNGESCSLSIANTQASLNAYTLTTANADGKTDNNAQTDIRDSDAVVSGNNAVINFTAGNAGQNNHGLDFGYQSNSTTANVIIHTPPAYNICKTTSVEQLDAFQYATATGTGASGTPSLTYTAPAGAGRAVIVMLSFERDHMPLPRGDNFETNPNVTFPTVTFGGVSMNRLAHDVKSRGSASTYTDAETSRSYYFYTLLDPNIPTGAQPIQVSDINAPNNAGDEAILAVATFANVGMVDVVNYAEKQTSPFALSFDAAPGMSNPADQPPGTSSADNMLLAFGISSKPENLTIGTSWTKLAEIPVTNNAGTYATAASRASGPFSENDGHTLLIQGIKGVSSTQTVQVSSSANNLATLASFVFRLRAHACDYGDAPASYGDAYHAQSWSRRIGAQRGDAETATPTAANANGDDTQNLDDEDGVTLPALTQGQSTTINVSVAGSAYLSGWVDWNGDGDFADTNEKIATDLQDNDADGVIPIPLNVPATATTTQTYARFRWAINPGVASDGFGSYGEVEDYALTISSVSVGNSSISGKVFEDKNYGGGAGRPATASGTAGINNVRVELYNATGGFVTSATTNGSGDYTFSNLASGNYFVRVVNDSVRSKRSGANGTERGVQTFRSDGTTAVTNEVGGRKPALVDAPANTTNQTLNPTDFKLSGGGQAQSVQPITIGGSNISGADFGFNFSTIVNANDSGQGSLRQFLVNASLFNDTATLAQAGLVSGKENAVFMLPTTDPNYNATDTYWSIALQSALPSIGNDMVLDGSKQAGFTNRPVIELNGTDAGNTTSGLTLNGPSSGAEVSYLAINRFKGAGITVIQSQNNKIMNNVIGLDPTATLARGNQGNGITVNAPLGSNSISTNRIAYNGGDGINAVGQDGRTVFITANSIYANTKLGIDLASNGITLNDANDADTGINNLLNFPMISNAQLSGNSLTLSGCAPAGAKVELFKADVSPTGTATAGANKFGKSKDYGEGQLFLGRFVEGSASDTNNAACNLAADADGNNQTGMQAFQVTVNLLAPLSAGDLLTATATLTSSGTSEFSPVFAPTAGCSLVVTTTADTDNAANNSGSLRDAIQCANSTPEADTITFNIPTSEPGYTNPDGIVGNGDDYWSIKPTTPLPGIWWPLIIDGSTQPGTSCPQPRVEIDGSSAGADADGIGLYASNSTIKGLIINNFSRYGIRLSRFPINFPTNTTLQKNNTVQCSYIGVNANGLVAKPNLKGGIAVEGDSMKIGGVNTAERNIISGNGDFGIYFVGGGSTNGTVQGNYIGVGANGITAIGNQGFGIGYYNTDGKGLIGGITGITINGGCTGACNLIAHNTSAGVGSFWTGPAGRNIRISGNSIHSNGGIGIDLEGGSSTPPWELDGVTPNDLGDSDPAFAPNALQNYPVISKAILSNGNTVVTGTLNSIANKTFTIEFFANTTVDPSGHGEGERYLGNATVNTDASGNANFTVNLPAVALGTFISSTATDSVDNTSEFSGSVAVTIERTLSGKVFEDINYGGGAGRNFDASKGMVGIAGASVELVDSSNAVIATTTTAADGNYTFAAIPAGNYNVRVVTTSVRSTRPGGNNPTVLGVSTYRTDGTTPAATISTAATQAVDLTSGDINGVNFGFNFDTVSNTNDSGAGSLRQFILNANLLGGDSSLQQEGLPAGKENAVLMLNNTDPNYSNGVWKITLNSSLPNIDKPLVLDGSKQNGFNAVNARPVIELNGNGSAGNGLTLVSGSSGSQIRSLAITNFGGDGINVQGDSTNNSFLGNSIHSNGDLGIDLNNDGVTANDAGDSDTGANNLLNYPEAKLNGFGTNGTRIVTYDFDLDVPTGDYRVEFFANNAADTSGHGEGQFYLGWKDITHPGTGKLNFQGTLNANQNVSKDAFVTTTLTRKTGAASFAETSEFSGTRKGTTTQVCEELTETSGSELLLRDENSTQIKLLAAKDKNGKPITYVVSGGADQYFFDYQSASNINHNRQLCSVGICSVKCDYYEISANRRKH